MFFGFEASKRKNIDQLCFCDGRRKKEVDIRNDLNENAQGSL